MKKFKVADEEFQPIAKELFEKHKQDLNLMVDPVKVMFLRSEGKKKGKTKRFAYCKMISGEYRLLTNKKFFIVIKDEYFNELTDEEKKYVILHELRHLYLDLDNEAEDKYGLIQHNIQDFQELLINPKWNLDLVKVVN